jgi:hypothetical protein
VKEQFKAHFWRYCQKPKPNPQPLEGKMKLIPRLLIAAFLVTESFAAVGQWNGVGVTQWNGVAQTGWNGTSISCASAGATYLINQRFEGTGGAPTDDGYDNSEVWTESLGTPNEDYTTTILQGSESLLLDSSGGTSQRADSPNFTATAHVYGYMRIRINAMPSSGSQSIFTVRNGTTALLDAQLNAAGTLRVDIGANSTLTVTAMSTGTTYHLWWEYQAGSGANAVGNIAFSTDGVRPTSGNQFSGRTDGTATLNANNIRLNAVSAEVLILDQVLIDDVQIGDNP